MSHDEYIKRKQEIFNSLTVGGTFGTQYVYGIFEAQQAIDKLMLELVASAKPAEYQAESWQQGLEKKAFDDAVRVYEYKLTTIVKGDN